MVEVFGEKDTPGSTDIDKELEALLQKQGARIKVVGCGGGGGNSVSRMKEAGIKGCEIIAVNTTRRTCCTPTLMQKYLSGES